MYLILDSAYLLLSDGKTAYSNVFADLAKQFVHLMDILLAMREVDNKAIYLDPLTAEELWRDTGSNHALQSLQQFTKQVSTPFTKLELPISKH